MLEGAVVGVGPLNQVWLQLAQVYPLKEQSTRSYNDYHAEADRLLALVSDKSEDEDDAGLGGRGPVRPATADPQLTSARRLRRAYYEISNVRRARALGRWHAGAGMRAHDRSSHWVRRSGGCWRALPHFPSQDVLRTYPYNIHLTTRTSPHIVAMERVLQAYSYRNPVRGVAIARASLRCASLPSRGGLPSDRAWRVGAVAGWRA